MAMYDKDYTNTELLTGEVPVPENARAFLAEVRKAEKRTLRTQADTHR